MSLIDKENSLKKELLLENIKSYFVVNDYFNKNGNTKKNIIENYLIKEASKLL